MAMKWVSSARCAMLGSICMSALAISGQALAQDAPPPADAAPGAEVPTAEGTPPADVQTQDTAAQGSDQDIIVTARRRSEVLQDVPIAVTAYSGEQLDRQGALDITDVADTTPNVNLETSRGTNTTLTAFIRGVGQQDPVAGFEQGVGICRIWPGIGAGRSCFGGRSAGRRSRPTRGPPDTGRGRVRKRLGHYRDGSAS